MRKQREKKGEKIQIDFASSVSSKSKEELMKLLGERLSEIRVDLKLTQIGLARVIGTTQNIVSRLEQGKSTSFYFILLLNFFLNRGYNINYILSENNEGISKKNPEAGSSEDEKDIDQYFEYIS